jgi:hypothetical protein
MRGRLVEGVPAFLERARERRARRRCERDGHVWASAPRIPPLSAVRFEDRCRRCGVWREPRDAYFEFAIDDDDEERRRRNETDATARGSGPSFRS